MVDEKDGGWTVGRLDQGFDRGPRERFSVWIKVVTGKEVEVVPKS